MVRPNTVLLQKRYNFMKAQWDLFSEALDLSKNNLEPLPEHYESFVEKVKHMSRTHIHVGHTKYLDYQARSWIVITPTLTCSKIIPLKIKPETKEKKSRTPLH